VKETGNTVSSNSLLTDCVYICVLDQLQLLVICKFYLSIGNSVQLSGDISPLSRIYSTNCLAPLPSKLIIAYQ
jgi:hypothetical protein